MDGFNPYNSAPHVVGPGSLAPQISDLGTMMDTLVQQRAHLAQLQRQQDAEDRQAAALAEKEAYGRRKQDLIEAKQNTKDRFDRATYNQKALGQLTQDVGSGKGARPTLFQGPTGEPQMVSLKYGVPVSRMPDPFDPQSAAEPQAAPPQAQSAPASSPQPQPDVGNLPPMMQMPFVLASQRKLPIPPVASAMPDGRSMVQQPEIERLMAQAHSQPQPAPVEQTGGNSVFLDETDDGQARALMGPDETQVKNLPLDAFPEGAKEGQRFNAADVNMRGGYGNPFSGAISRSAPESSPDTSELDRALAPKPAAPAPQSSSMTVPGQQIRGMSARLPQDQGGVWEGDIPGMGHVSIDPAEARAARLDDVKQKVAQAEAMMSDPTTPREMIPLLARERVTMLAQIDPQDRRLLLGQTGAMDLDTQKGGRQQEMQTERLGTQKDIEQMKQDGMLARQQAKHKRSASSVIGGSKIVPDGVTYIPIPQTRYGARPDMLLSQVRQDWRSASLDEKLPTQLLGLRRLRMADHNLNVDGPNSGTVNIEAAFNYLGFVRGGVPVENETKQMLDKRRTAADLIHGVLARAGLGEAWARFSKGEELTKQEVNAAVNVMSPEEKNRIRVGIDESLSIMTAQVGQSIQPFVEKFSHLGGPGGHLMRQEAVAIVNERMKAAGLPADYNPFTDTKTASQSPFMRKDAQAPGEASQSEGDSTPSSSGTSAAPGATSSALDKLIEMKLSQQKTTK
jgi:hypothetical protein